MFHFNTFQKNEEETLRGRQAGSKATGSLRACSSGRGHPWPASDFHRKNSHLKWQTGLRQGATISMQPNEAPIFIFPGACWAPNFLVKMETVRQDFVQICTFLGGKHSESTTCSFIWGAFCPQRLHQRWERWVGRAVGSTGRTEHTRSAGRASWVTRR